MHLLPIFNCALWPLPLPCLPKRQGSVEEDPVALLQASHTAAKPSKVWCALLLAHMQLVPSSPCSHRVLCCAVNSLPRLVTLQCSTVTSPIEEWMMSSFWLLPLHLFVWFCCSFFFPSTSPVYQVCVYSAVVIPGVSASRITTGFLLHNKPKAFLNVFIYLVSFYISLSLKPLARYSHKWKPWSSLGVWDLPCSLFFPLHDYRSDQLLTWSSPARSSRDTGSTGSSFETERCQHDML